jgi:hypothetical protein
VRPFTTFSFTTMSDENTAPPPRGPNPRDEPLQPAVIAGLALASVAVLVGFIVLFILWRRQYVRERRENSGMYPNIQLQSQDDAQGGELTVWWSHYQS